MKKIAEKIIYELFPAQYHVSDDWESRDEGSLCGLYPITPYLDSVGYEKYDPEFVFWFDEEIDRYGWSFTIHDDSVGVSDYCEYIETFKTFKECLTSFCISKFKERINDLFLSDEY